MPPAIPERDRHIVRELARRVREIAHDPVMDERRRLWTAHNDLHGERPMILAEHGGAGAQTVPDTALQCESDYARGIERGLRSEIFRFEHVRDDHVVVPHLNYNWQVQIGDYGLVPEKKRGDSDGAMGSYRWDAPMQDLDADFEKIHPRELSVDREATEAGRERLDGLLGDILPLRLRGAFWWTQGLTWRAIELIGLDNLMLYMYDNPDGLHRLMAFLRDDHMHVVDWCVEEGLLTLNNENDYIGSGGEGFTADLPAEGFAPGEPARPRDLWVLSESQETVGVSPAMFAEFIFPYQLPIIERFGLCYYGCCEPVHSRWDSLAKIPNLRAVSISPWCDEAAMAEAMGRDYVFARKPNPALVSRAHLPEDEIRADIRHTLEVAGKCELEFVMKDVHTLGGEPGRLGRWCDIVREEIGT